uniref:Uncharacterized protein n=1 Tax=Meloidogyne hapla TaxID=6305 RepID=A0A1I8BWE0_MELHA
MSSENEYSEGDDSSQNGKKKKRKHGEANTRGLWSKNVKDRVNECQQKIFGGEKNPETKYQLSGKNQNEIVEYYIHIDEDFKKGIEVFKKNKLKRKNVSTVLSLYINKDP